MCSKICVICKEKGDLRGGKTKGWGQEDRQNSSEGGPNKPKMSEKNIQIFTALEDNQNFY